MNDLSLTSIQTSLCPTVPFPCITHFSFPLPFHLIFFIFHFFTVSFGCLAIILLRRLSIQQSKDILMKAVHLGILLASVCKLLEAALPLYFTANMIALTNIKNKADSIISDASC